MELIKRNELERVNALLKMKGEKALTLAVTSDTVKDVKKVRAENNKIFKEIAETYKEVKDLYMQEWNAFDKEYKETIVNVHKHYDSALKSKISDVESELKLQKEKELREYFEEYCKSLNIDFVTFERLKLNITLSASLKSLKTKITTFLDCINNDLDSIKSLNRKNEVLIEYKECLDFGIALNRVVKRWEKLEEMEEEVTVKENEVEEVEEFTAPVIEEIKTVTFTVTGTRNKLLKLKEFLEKEGIDYE